MSDADLFRAPSQWYFPNPEVSLKVDQLMASQEMTYDEVAIKYDQESTGWAKGLIVVLVPLVGLALALFLWGHPAGLYVVFATHFFTFFLTYLLIIGVIIWPFLPVQRFVLQAGIILGILYYFFRALPQVYGIGAWRSAGLAVVLSLISVLLIVTYRNKISDFSLWYIS